MDIHHLSTSLPSLSELQTADVIRVYNNAATWDGNRGRLLVDWKTTPVPQIHFDFEVIGDLPDEYPESNIIEGSGIKLHDVRSYLRSQQKNGHSTIWAMMGNAARIILGEADDAYHLFTVLLPNLKLHEISYDKQEFIDRHLIERGKDEERDSVTFARTEKKKLELTLANGWNIAFETKEENLEWLRNQSSKGTRLTTVMSVSLPQSEAMTLRQFEEFAVDFCYLLSFANGGVVNPAFIEALEIVRGDHIKINKSISIPCYYISEMQQCGFNWFAQDTDMVQYLNCFTSLQKMLKNDTWKNAWSIIQIWYFQAIQPNHYGYYKPWNIRANALGAIFETLFFVIGVEELGFAKKRVRPSGKRTNKTLAEKMIELIHYTGTPFSEGTIRDFVKIRNIATHPSSQEPSHIFLVNEAQTWVEEIILWRLGYEGHYRPTWMNGQSTQSHWDLSKRLTNW